MCPECHSSNFKVMIMHCWKNPITEQLYEEGRLSYGPGAYDRRGTRAQTHECLECGCKWHNSVTLLRWNEIIRQGGLLTKEDLGIL